MDRGAEQLGLRDLVDAQDMTGLCEHFLDPRELGFRDKSCWDEVFTLGHTGRKYQSEDTLYAAALARAPPAAGRAAQWACTRARPVRQELPG
ncbi:hypothetical protein LWC33_32215 [Pseudonocardia sp. RS11V-5]|uniref:hypothetical protein n=1 Tax=Pseudonocardia terrae TaxID=2905831 RepID=UPI001E3DC7C8|nr:hypothetical protein [Pseudonocardia terrae]MCE3556094.1 hypothetical protein [Pseudonocardia terrae]